jgi:hypothetical protein
MNKHDLAAQRGRKRRRPRDVAEECASCRLIAAKPDIESSTKTSDRAAQHNQAVLTVYPKHLQPMTFSESLEAADGGRVL